MKLSVLLKLKIHTQKRVGLVKALPYTAPLRIWLPESVTQLSLIQGCAGPQSLPAVGPPQHICGPCLHFGLGRWAFDNEVPPVLGCQAPPQWLFLLE
jgi:hypothetical protein